MPPGIANNEDQASGEGPEDFQALPCVIDSQSWMTASLGPVVSLCNAATGCDALHCATTSRAQVSHRPHCVATPSSSWMSSKPIPALTWRAMSRSEIRWQTQTIMVGLLVVGCWSMWLQYKYESLAFAMKSPNHFAGFFIADSIDTSVCLSKPVRMLNNFHIFYVLNAIDSQYSWIISFN
jgi:hypothetical protein